MAFFSLMFLIFFLTSETVIVTIGSFSFSILFASFPIYIFLYLRSFSSIKVNGNTIKIIQKGETVDFTVPYDLGRVKIYADDLQIELKKSGHRFVLRSHFLKNKTTFHELFDRMIKDHPPSKDKVVLHASILEIMDRLKTK
jgi:hypothetical protein